MTGRRLLSRELLAATACFVLLSHCGKGVDEEPPPRVETLAAAGCEQEHFEACNVYERLCQRTVFSATACLWGAGRDTPPAVEFISADEYRERIRASVAAAQPSAEERAANETLARAQGRALALLGLGSPDDFLPADMEELLVSTVPAYFDGRAVVFVQPETAVHERTFGELTVLLSHEFAHALQAATIDWSAIGPEPNTYDSGLAYLSVLEGSAEVVAALYDAAMWGLDPRKIDVHAHLTAWLERVKADLSGASALLGTRRYFPYTYGATYAYNAYLDGGTKALHEIFRPVPPSTLSILWTEEEAPPADVEPLPTDAPLAPEGYQLVYTDRLGAWILQHFMERIAGSDSTFPDSTFPDLAWRDDRLFAYRRELDDVAAVWTVRLRDAATAEELLRIVQNSELSTALRVATVEGSDVRLVLSEDPGSKAQWSALFDTDPAVADGTDAGTVDAGGASAPRADAGDADAGDADAGDASAPDTRALEAGGPSPSDGGS